MPGAPSTKMLSSKSARKLNQSKRAPGSKYSGGAKELPPGEGNAVGTKEKALFCNIEQTLKSHNDLRKMHGAPPLEWSDQCAFWAATCAIDNSNEGRMRNAFNRKKHDVRIKFDQGQNIYWQSNNKFPDSTPATEWYKEIADPGYDFGRPGQSSGTGQFSQVVWHDTTHVGMARSPCGCFVVANYFPPGNWMMPGEFEANVAEPDAAEYATYRIQEKEARDAARIKCADCTNVIPRGQPYCPAPKVLLSCVIGTNICA